LKKKISSSHILPRQLCSIKKSTGIRSKKPGGAGRKM
jgi:hypothetical protein